MSPGAALAYDMLMWPFELLMIGRWRRRLWRQVRGPVVLEAGVGTGRSISHYRQDLQVTAVDESSVMLERARRRAEGSGAGVNLLQADVQDLPFAAGRFDAAVTTFLLCSVEDPTRCLRELGRVVRPGGQLLLLEQVRPQSLPGRVLHRLGAPLYRLTGDYFDRDAIGEMERAGLEPAELTPLLLDAVQIIRARRR